MNDRSSTVEDEHMQETLDETQNHFRETIVIQLKANMLDF